MTYNFYRSKINQKGGVDMFHIIKSLHLLTLSFFILFAATKTDSDRLKQFARILAITIIIVATALILFSIYLNLIYIWGI